MDTREKLNEFAELRGWNKNKLIGWSEAADFGDWLVKNCFIPVVTQRFLSADEKVEQFKKELKVLLVKFDAELIIEDFGRDWSSYEKIVVNFNWDEDLANRTENGIVPDWVIGRWENGR